MCELINPDRSRGSDPYQCQACVTCPATVRIGGEPLCRTCAERLLDSPLYRSLIDGARQDAEQRRSPRRTSNHAPARSNRYTGVVAADGTWGVWDSWARAMVAGGMSQSQAMAHVIEANEPYAAWTHQMGR